MKPRYSQLHISVDLKGPTGNAFCILGQATRLLREAGASDDEVRAFLLDAMDGDYDHLLEVVARWLTVDLTSQA